MKRVSTFSQITSAYYTTIDTKVSKGKPIKEEVITEEEDDTASLSPIASNMVAPIYCSQIICYQ